MDLGLLGTHLERPLVDEDRLLVALLVDVERPQAEAAHVVVVGSQLQRPPVGLLGALDVPGAVAGQAEVVPEPSVLGRDAGGALQRANGLVGQAELQVGRPQRQLRRARLGRRLDGPPVVLERLVEASLALGDQGEQAMWLRAGGRPRDQHLASFSASPKRRALRRACAYSRRARRSSGERATTSPYCSSARWWSPIFS